MFFMNGKLRGILNSSWLKKVQSFFMDVRTQKLSSLNDITKVFVIEEMFGKELHKTRAQKQKKS